MKAPVSGGERIDQTKIVPEGKHVAILYSIIDLGTQETNTERGIEFKRKIQLFRELPRVLHEFKQGEGERPATVKAKVTLSMHEKAELRKIVHNLLGRELTNEQAKEFDVSSLLGTMCQLQVAHASYEGRPYLKPTNYIYLTDEEKEFYESKGYSQINPSLIFDLSEFSQSKFDTLDQFLKDIIIKSPEYNKRDMAERTAEELVEELETETAKNDPEQIPVNDDLPY